MSLNFEPFEGVFAPLLDPASFRAVRVEPEAGTVVWTSGADLDPDVLYAEVTSVPVADRLARPRLLDPPKAYARRQEA